MTDEIIPVVEQIAQLVEPVLDEMGFELVDVEYRSERGRWVLRIYLDKEGGVTLDDCARASVEIGPLIDVRDIIAHGYVLEVSSPGLNRPLKRGKDFLRAVGKKVKVRTVAPVKGRRNFTGLLRRFENGALYLETDKTVVTLSLRDVEKANLMYEFGK
jgi:ribosome maturation factor RimP